MPVRPAGLQGDGGDAAGPEPGDEVAQAGRVGGELADGVGRRRGWRRRRPSGWRRPTSMPAAWRVGRTGRRRPVRAAWAAVRVGSVGVGAGGRAGAVGSCERPWCTPQWCGRRECVRRGSRHGNQPSQRDQPPVSVGAAVVTKRVGRKRSPSQSNPRAERERLGAPETRRASAPHAGSGIGAAAARGQVPGELGQGTWQTANPALAADRRGT